MADELRNPQAPIRIAMSMLGRIKTDEPLLPMVQEVVEQQLAHMSHLVGSLLDTTPETQPAAQRRHVVVDMVEVVARAVAAQQPAMVARGQHFSLHQPSGPLQVLGDPSRLEQIVSNLLDNATKHTHDKGHIVLQMRVANGVLTLTVQDDGIGITPAMLPFVFDPFVQDTRALGFNGVGLGIGLTVVRALVQAHGGTLRAHSEGSGEGSRFVVALPLASAASVAP